MDYDEEEQNRAIQQYILQNNPSTISFGSDEKIRCHASSSSIDSSSSEEILSIYIIGHNACCMF